MEKTISISAFLAIFQETVYKTNFIGGVIMSRTLSSSEAYEISKRIYEAGNDRRKLEAIKEILEQYNDNDPEVKELIYKLGI